MDQTSRNRSLAGGVPSSASPATALLVRVLRRFIRNGELTIVDHKGRSHVIGAKVPGWPEARLRFLDRRVPAAMLRDPVLGLGEAYMAGRAVIEHGDVLDVATIIRGNSPWEEGGGFPRSRRIRARLDRINWPARARRNVAHHYDLADGLFPLFLGDELEYSCAYFRNPDATLDQAQADKRAHIAAKLLLRPGQRVLDIGCGWGGLALYLHRVAGVDVLGVTLSERQVEIARRRAAAAGVADRVRFELRDYREIQGRFDRIVSIGMFEHVGPLHYRTFFDACRRLLAPDGVMLLHTIGRLGTPVLTDAWLRKYIFPGGHTPALSQIVRASETARLIAADVETLRLHYAHTLHHWYLNAWAHREEIEGLYDARFFRMWLYYLAGALISFRFGGLCNYQIQFVRERSALPLVRDYRHEAEARLRGESTPG
ncbi:class I SAM-dependent methyltransferase [Sphingomonas parva]|uniref:Class I SAM-dependent methyltransferase n=1 Tax=Sphingomonas parva TaxID=2555898 RepID=A0A4Y8ZSJ0_9SPHN|nr:cyclopropane-fatty-acyl-phospholipid synthase family protein [Sphingomonas parva]TFI59008.1 class I SAM-dependent methyltransferase [Sphingomonas parva]